MKQRHWAGISAFMCKEGEEREKVSSPNPVTKLVLLQELFGEVLEVPLAEGNVRSHCDLRVSIPGELDAIAKLTSLALDLDTIVQEFLKISTIEDTCAFCH
jgi:hypothetical protein